MYAIRSYYALALWWHATVPAIEVLGLFISVVGAPLVEGKGRIGDHGVELHQVV